MTELRFGIVDQVDYGKGLVRVRFIEDDDLLSPWMPVIQAKTMGDKFAVFPDEGEHVACTMTDNGDTGVVMGAIYSKSVTPDGSAKDKSRVKFSDGTTVEYDLEAHRLTVKIEETEFKISTDGYTVKTADESLKTVLSDLIDAILAETHTTGAPGSPTSPPINSATYTDIKSRLNDLFEA